jgi:hypothetical protein
MIIIYEKLKFKAMTKLFLMSILGILLVNTSYITDRTSIQHLDNLGYDFSTSDPAKILIINPTKISDTISFRATDLIKDFEIIKLETNNESLIDYIMRCYVGEKSIVISTVNNGILLFSRDGKFLKQVAASGRGPGEVNNPNSDITVDEKNNLLYVGSSFPRSGLIDCFNLKSGTHSKIAIQSSHSIRDIIVKNDSIMILSIMPIQGAESNCPIISQTTGGKHLWEITNKNKFGATNGTIQSLYDQVYFRYIWGGDTLYKVTEEKMTPIIAIQYKGKMFLNTPYKEGDIFLSILPLNHTLFRGKYSSIVEIKTSEANRQEPILGDKIDFIIDYKKGKAFRLTKLDDNFLGTSSMFDFRIQNNGTIYRNFTVQQIKQIAKDVKENPSIAKDVKARILKLDSEISESDNPILLVGKLKDSPK